MNSIAPYNDLPLREAIVTQQHDQVGSIINKDLGMAISSKKLEELAHEYSYLPLQNAIEAAQNMVNLDGRADLQYPLLRAAFYIETSLKKHLDQNQFRMPRDMTGQFFTLEHDHAVHRTYIHTEDEMGKGAHKATRKSYEYSVKKPLLIANSITQEDCAAEIGKLKLFQGVKGAVELRSVTTYNDKQGRRKTSIKTPLHNLGSISQGKAAKDLTTHEKFAAVIDILTGLNGIHQKGHIHRDVHPGNIFVYKNKGQVGASIGDFATSNTLEAVKGERPNSFTMYNPPEALNQDLRGIDYQRAEGFSAAACIYELVFDKPMSWNPGGFFHDIGNMPQGVKNKNQGLMKIELEKERTRLRGLIDPKNEKETNLLYEALIGLLHQNANERLSVQKALELLDPQPAEKAEKSVAEKLSLDEVTEKDDGHSGCAICFETEVSLVEITKCHHIFCRKCLSEWHNKNKTCPIDREAFDITQVKDLKEMPAIDKTCTVSFTILFSDEEIRAKTLPITRDVLELKEFIAQEVNKQRQDKKLPTFQTRSFVLVLLDKGENVQRLVPGKQLKEFGMKDGKSYEVTAVAKYVKDKTGKIPCDSCYEVAEKEASCNHS